MDTPPPSKARLVVEAALERKALDPVLLKVDRITSIADYFLVCSGRSNRQVQALADHIRDQVKQRGGHLPLGEEGRTQGHWILMDYGEIIVHIFYHPIREFYDLEGLWIEAEQVELDRENDL